jgi:hypothetical protein
MLTLTIFHDGQYWTEMMEENNRLSIKAFKKVFGVRPSDKEILDFINSKFFIFSKKNGMQFENRYPKKRRKTRHASQKLSPL